MELKLAQRYFLPNKLVLTKWEDIEPFFTELILNPIQSIEELSKWLRNRSELDAFLEENLAWRYIKMTIDTRDEQLTQDYNYFIAEIQPKLAPLDDQLNRKLIDSPFFSEIEKEEAYFIYFRAVKTATELFREENIEIEAEINEKSQLFGSVSGAQMIEFNGEQLTMQKASSLLREPNEKLRKEVFEKISNRRKEDVDELDQLYTYFVKGEVQSKKLWDRFNEFVPKNPRRVGLEIRLTKFQNFNNGWASNILLVNHSSHQQAVDQPERSSISRSSKRPIIGTMPFFCSSLEQKWQKLITFEG